MRNDNERAGLDAWIGLIAALLFSVFYYVAVLPPWKGIVSSLTQTWATGFMPIAFLTQLEWVLQWAPIIFCLIAVFWAFISPIRKQGQSWRNM